MSLCDSLSETKTGIAARDFLNMLERALRWTPENEKVQITSTGSATDGKGNRSATHRSAESDTAVTEFVEVTESSAAVKKRRTPAQFGVNNQAALHDSSNRHNSVKTGGISFTVFFYGKLPDLL